VLAHKLGTGCGRVYELMPLVDRFFFAVRTRQSLAPFREIGLGGYVEGVIKRWGGNFRMNKFIFAMMAVKHPFQHLASQVFHERLDCKATRSDFLIPTLW
jgi:hypothetical protein